MGGRGSGGSRGGGGGSSNKTPSTKVASNKIKKGTPYLKNMDDPRESKALKEKTLKDIDRLLQRTKWHGDEKLNKIKSGLARTPNSDSESILTLADTFFRHKPEHLETIRRHTRGY